MTVLFKRFLITGLLLVSPWVFAAESLKVQKVADNVYAIVGDLGNRSAENFGNNATFGFVVTGQGVVLIDSGGTYDGAVAIHDAIKTVTDKPVVKVINSGGQDHRWLGNGYFKQLGASIIASEAAVADQKARSKDQFFMLGTLVGADALKRTEAVYADETFGSQLDLDLGGVRFEIRNAGPAHTPGDSFVWLPQQSVMFTGDIVYVERMLGIMDFSNSKSWVKVFEAMAAFKPTHVVPGHGHPTDLNTATKDSYDYLVQLRQSVVQFMDAGHDISDIGNVDQSAFSYLLNFDTLAGRNAQRVYAEMEWE